MSQLFNTNNPGVGDAGGLTLAEQELVEDLAGLTYAQGDILYYNGTQLTNLGPGTDGQLLKTQGAGANPIWATVAGSGDVAKVGTPVNNQLGVWTGDGTIEGDSALTFDTSTDTLYVGGTFELGHASDTTLTRVSAGVVAVEGIPLATTTITDGKENYHGVQSHGTLSFNNSTHILTIGAATNTYWFQGVKYTTANAITCDIDDYETLTANTLYFIAFDDATGTLKASADAWGFTTHVPVATVFWNGSAGSVCEETHGHTRDLDWHAWAHATVGARYGSGLSLTAPTVAADATLTIESGSIYDEDHVSTIAQQTTSRIWYQVSAGVYTFVDSSLPYAGTSGNPQYLDTDTWTLTDTPDNDWVNMWVYATPDIDRPIHIIPTQATDSHDTIALARAEQPPALSGLNLAPEMKLIYKFIYDGDGNFIESVDYRNASVLPAGGTASTSASAVSFVPTGNIASTTVQTAIEELDTEKAPIASPTFTGTVSLPNTKFADGTGIQDESGNEQILFQTTGSAVNYLEIQNGATLTNPTIRGEGSDADVGVTFVVKGAGKIVIPTATIASVISPASNDGASLGAVTTGEWSDLFLAEGGVINWDNGDATLTQTGNVLKLAGASLETDGNIELGHASDTTISRVSAGLIAVEGSNLIRASDVDDTPVNGETAVPVSSNWAYDHAAATAVHGVSGAVVGTTDTQTLSAKTLSGAIPLEENASVDLDAVLSADGKYTGIAITGTAGTALAFGDLVYLAAADSRWELCDASAVGTAGTVLVGICVLAAAGDASATKVLLQGTIRADAVFPALTISAPVYISETAGDVTQTAPTTADAVVRVLGYAITADSMFFNPSPDHITHT